MGLAALRRVLDPKPAALSDFGGEVVAVDANNMLWSFVTAMGARGDPPLGPDGRPVSHVIGLVNRLKLYAEHGIRSVWVFDGPQPKLKEATIQARRARIEAARARGDTAGGIALSSRELQEAWELLRAAGVPVVEAPSEADAQAAHFVRSGAAWAAVTQDYDAALHACPRTGRNLTGSQTRTPELMHLAPALEAHGITHTQLVDASILIGTDYNDGIKGVGPVRALKVVKKEGDLFGALEALGVDMPEADAVRRLFLEHPVDEDVELTFGTPDKAAVRDRLEGYGLSRARADDLLHRIGPLHEAPRV